MAVWSAEKVEYSRGLNSWPFEYWIHSKTKHFKSLISKVQISNGFEQNGHHFVRISNGVWFLNGLDKMAVILFGFGMVLNKMAAIFFWFRMVLNKMAATRKPNTIRKPNAIDHSKSERALYSSPHCSRYHLKWPNVDFVYFRVDRFQKMFYAYY